jgi:hypothetical protein
MDNKVKIQIGIALGWYVFIDITLRTSSTVIGAFAVADSATQSIFYFLGNSNSFYDTALSRLFYSDAYPILLLGIGVLIMAIVFLLQNLLRIWTGILRLTKALAYYIIAINKREAADEQPEEELLKLLFGEKENPSQKTSSLKEKEEKKGSTSRPIVFRLISDISITWLLIGIVHLLYSLFSSLRF